MHRLILRIAVTRCRCAALRNFQCDLACSCDYLARARLPAKL